MVYATVISSSSWLQHISLQTKNPFLWTFQLRLLSVMYEVVLDSKDLAMELFYSLQEGRQFSLSCPITSRIKSLRRSGGYQGILHRTQNWSGDFCAVCLTPQILKTNSDTCKEHTWFWLRTNSTTVEQYAIPENSLEFVSEWLNNRLSKLKLWQKT